MPRAKTPSDVLTYKFAALEPADGGMALVLEEHFRQRGMWDEMVRATNAANWQYVTAARSDKEIDSISIEIESLDAKLNDMFDERNKQRASVRSKSEDDPELQAEIDKCVLNRKEFRKKRNELLKVWKKENKDIVKDIETRRKERCQVARTQSGLLAANSDRVFFGFDDGLKRLRKAKRGGQMRYSDPTRKDGILMAYTDYVRKHKDGAPDGIKGAKYEHLLDGLCNDFSMEPVDPRAWDKTEATKGERRRLRRTNAYIRVDKAGNRIKIPFIMHRPFPEGYRIKRVSFTWRDNNGKMEYALNFSLVRPAEGVVKHSSRKAIGVDLNWATEPEGALQVAVAVDSDGLPDFVTLSPHLTGGYDLVDRLTSHMAEESKKLLEHWYWQRDRLPEFFAPYFKGWSPKTSVSRFDSDGLHKAVKSVIRVGKEAGDVPAAIADIPGSIMYWYERYDHLLHWRDAMKRKLPHRRREIYRLFAKHLAENYSIIAIEKLDGAKMAKVNVAPGEKENSLSETARRNRQRAAPFELHQEIKRAAMKAGAEVWILDGASTKTCHVCYHVNQHIAGSGERMFTCANCGAEWNRDINSATNLVKTVMGEKTGLRVVEKLLPLYKEEPCMLTFEKPKVSPRVPASDCFESRLAA